MLAQIDPSADVIWGSVATIETSAGVEEKRPVSPEDWESLRPHALTLIEAGNLLLIPHRRIVANEGTVLDTHVDGVLDHHEIAAAIERDHAAFITRVRALQDAGTATLVAIERRDVAGLFDAGEKLQQACDACHSRFWFPGDLPPADPEHVQPLEAH